MAAKCKGETEVYARVCGFFRPLRQWNKGKKEEYRERREFAIASFRRHLNFSQEAGWAENSQGESVKAENGAGLN